MGCHTWFYKKIDRSVEEARKIAINTLYKYIKLCENIIADKNYNDRDWNDFDKHGNTNDDVRKQEILISERKIRIIEKGLCNVAVYNMEQESNVLIEDNFYIESDFHDIFRKSGYPDITLYSLDETLSYIEDPNNNCYYEGEPAIKALKEFWSEHPDGIIQFG